MIQDGNKNRRSWLFKMTLSFSRHSYEELVFRQDFETFVHCHENAFKSFGGVPETIKLDNLKSGVLKGLYTIKKRGNKLQFRNERDIIFQ
jgi:transposase